MRIIKATTSNLKTLISFILPTICFAEPMGIIFVEGDKPSRVAYAAEFLNIYDRSSSISAFMNSKTDAEFNKLKNEQKQAEMRVIAIYENKTAPESIDMTLEFQCHDMMYSINQAHAMLRDGSEKRIKQDWKPYVSSNSAFLRVLA